MDDIRLLVTKIITLILVIPFILCLSMTKKIGITGGICSGKSFITSILKDKCQCSVIDADKIGHESYTVGTTCYNKVIEAFGRDIIAPDQQIDRRKLGSIIFSDITQKKKLENIVWPEIRKRIEEKIVELERLNVNVIVIEAAVMIEACWYDLFDQVWVTTTPPEITINRLIKRNNLSLEEAQKRLSSQLNNEERIQYATVVIDTNKSFDDVEADVIKHYHNLSIQL